MVRILLVVALCTLTIIPQEVFAAHKNVIVGFHQKPGLQEHAKITSLWGHVKRAHKLIPALTAELPDTEIESLRRDPRVAYVVEDVTVSLPPVTSQSVVTPEYAESWGVQRIGAATAASRNVRGAGVKVAIIDTGIDYSHPDLMENYRGGYNFITETAPPLDDSSNSHGTHVAGIIAAKDNGTGVVGVAPDAELYALKVLDHLGFGSLSGVIAAIEWAIANKMDVINLSLGGLPVDFPPLKDVCDRAVAAGIVMVAAAGNSGIEQVDYPAAYESVIAVSSVDRNDQRAASSSYGSAVELAAPGVDILSTVRGGGYATLSGTSQAVPHVVGAAALVISQGIQDANGNGTRVDEVRSRLDTTATDLGAIGRDPFFGYGLVDVAKATETAVQPATYRYTLKTTFSDPLKNAIKITLPVGTYEMSVTNSGLNAVLGKVEVNGIIDIHQSFIHWFGRNKPQTFTVGLDFPGGEGKVVAVPIGKRGASAEILITRKN